MSLFLKPQEENVANNGWNPEKNQIDKKLQEAGYDGSNMTREELIALRTNMKDSEARNIAAQTKAAALNNQYVNALQREQREVLGSGVTDVSANPSGRQASSLINDTYGGLIASNASNFASEIANNDIKTREGLNNALLQSVNRQNALDQGQLQAVLADMNYVISNLPLKSDVISKLQSEVSTREANDVQSMFNLLQMYANLNGLDPTTLTSQQQTYRTQVLNQILTKIKKMSGA